MSLEKEVNLIESQLRKMESIISTYHSVRDYSTLPSKSTPRGLSALNDLEHLAVESSDNQAARALAFCSEDSGRVAELVARTLRTLGATGATEEIDHRVGEDLQELTEMLKEDGVAAEWTLAPPGASDSAPNAQNARWPILAALQQICQDGRRRLGIAEAACHEQHVPSERNLKKIAFSELLDAAIGRGSFKVLGDGEVLISGVVDVIERAMAGDLLLVSVDGCDEDLLSNAFQDANERGVSALVLLTSNREEQMLIEKLWSSPTGGRPDAVVALPKASEPQVSLARAYFGSGQTGMRKIAVVGEDELEIRAAAWLLFKMLEVHAGASRTGLINDRCSLIAHRSLGIFGGLTVCAVEEILAGMREADVDFCVAEVLPSTNAFSPVNFDLVLDLGGGRDVLGSEVICRKPSSTVSTCATYSFEVPIASETEYKDLTKAKLVEELVSRGFDEPQSLKSKTKQELLETLQAIADAEAEDEPDLLSGNDADGTNLHAVFTLANLEGLELILSGLKINRMNLCMPWLGSCSPNAVTAALCAASHIIQQEASLEATCRCLQCLPSIATPPAILEVSRAGEGSEEGDAKTSHLGILHEVSCPSDMTVALQTVESLKDPEATVTAVFGCDGEVSRKERVKYAWALAQSCAERIVLTSANCGTEPPLQVIEDMLEALRGVRRWMEEEMSKPLEVFVVVDRADAIKLGTITDSENSVTLVFGSGYKDFYEAPDEDGVVQAWLFNDRSLLTEALSLAGEMRKETTMPPWTKKPKVGFTYPGRSLHWSYGINMNSDGQMIELL
ncbi:6-diaminopimelate ligase (Meso-A2pm-adding enzyme) (Meso-diaminopimelate-adding enzyme) (UDP-MurNAc-L-Ala-D-Glu:meso-diaminopimelate ligase) (UDP-MurNAc-tripeptide synthetase) (UDP-N-acetylmuramyl-tripeptide synthetase) [Durusdinium trenchii]